MTNEQIAQNMGITRETLRVWSNKYSVISVALKRGKEIVDRQVENALLKRALGYQYDEVTREMVEDGSGRLVVTKVVTKEVQPDVTAQIFWLKNRKPEVWRDTQLQQLQAEKLKSEIELAKIAVRKENGEEDDEYEDDGFMEALGATAVEVWGDEDD